MPALPHCRCIVCSPTPTEGYEAFIVVRRSFDGRAEPGSRGRGRVEGPCRRASALSDLVSVEGAKRPCPARPPSVV